MPRQGTSAPIPQRFQAFCALQVPSPPVPKRRRTGHFYLPQGNEGQVSCPQSSCGPSVTSSPGIGVEGAMGMGWKVRWGWGGRCDRAGSRDSSSKARHLADMTAGAQQRQCPICLLVLSHLLCPPPLVMDWAEVLLSPTERKK